MRGFRTILAAVTAASFASPAVAQVVPRAAEPAGSVIARKSGEEIRFIEVSDWQTVDVSQDLLAGDVLRTNATGQLAVLFSDRTQMRLARNTTLLVKQIGAASDSVFSLQAGTVWGRAQRGGIGLTVETPAAAAAIRGTDWTMTVEGDRTSLIVLEGVVDLTNEFGSVSVAEGEAAVARIGQAPTKVIIVDPDDREQMLFYLSLRGSFNFLPASPLPSRDMRMERSRIAAIPESRRSAEEWVTLAETGLSYEGRQAALDAVAAARRFRLSGSQEARLNLVEALIAGAEQRYDDAARLFESAAPRLDPQRRAVAAYGGYFSRALADPDRVEQPPSLSGGGPYGALAQALTAGFLQDTKAAIEVLRRAEQRFPDDPTLPAARAQFALLLDDREQVREAVGRALALDPDDPTALEARANYRAGIESDLEGALQDLQRAVEIAPGSTTIWNALGLVQSARGADREAEAALKRAIELDPQDPVSHANLAILYLDQDRLREAKEEIDAALASDPSFDIALIARGRYYLQTGEMEKAQADLLAGTTANPAYAQGLLLLGAGFYESGERDPAEQALENADRLDPNDPVVSSFRTAVAIDDYDAPGAIAAAQETLRRSRARGGDYAAVSANRDAGSLLNNAFRLQGLEAWGRFYGDVVFDPFAGASFVDQAVSGSADPFVNDLDFGGNPIEPVVNNSGFSSFFQGLLLSPEMLSGRSRSANLFRRPFLEGSIGGGFVARDGEDLGWTAEGEVQGFAAAPFPVSFFGTFAGRKDEDARDARYTSGGVDSDVGFTLGNEDFSGSGYIGAKPTPNDRVVAYIDARRDGDEIRDGVFDYEPGLAIGAIPFIPDVGLALSLTDSAYDREVEDRSLTSGVAWSHTFGYRNVASAAVFASGFKRTSEEEGALDFDAVPFDIPTGTPIIDPATGEPFVLALEGDSAIDAEFRQSSTIAALAHSWGIGDVTLRYGIEGGRVSQERKETNLTDILFGGALVSSTAERSEYEVELTATRAYLDALYEITPTLTAEAGLFGTFLRSDEVMVDGVEAASIGVERAEPRLGLAWQPVAGQWLRAGYLRESGAFASGSLAPVGVVGLQSNQLPLAVTGYSDTFAARWEAEWTDRFFTSLDFQHQQFEELNIPVPGGIATADVEDGRLNRIAATANYHLGGGWGVFGTLAHTDSEGENDPDASGLGGYDGALPFVPEWSGRVGFTYVHPSNLKVTLAATYIGERLGGLSGDTLGDYWTADAFLIWEPFDKRFALQLAAYNLFDEKFDVATRTPGWGRSIVGSFKVRF